MKTRKENIVSVKKIRKNLSENIVCQRKYEERATFMSQYQSKIQLIHNVSDIFFWQRQMLNQNILRNPFHNKM